MLRIIQLFKQIWVQVFKIMQHPLQLFIVFYNKIAIKKSCAFIKDVIVSFLVEYIPVLVHSIFLNLFF